MSGFFSGREDSGGARDAYHRDTEITEATWTCARLHVIPFSREDAKTGRETMSTVHRVFPFAASRLRVSPSLKGREDSGGARDAYHRDTEDTEKDRFSPCSQCLCGSRLSRLSATK